MRTSDIAGLVLAAVAAAAAPAAVSAQAVHSTTSTTADARGVLRQCVVVEAPADSVWRALSTAEGLRSFEAPVADITLAVGGLRREIYDPGGRLGGPRTIVNEILAFVPNEMMAIRVKRPPAEFPFPEAVKELWTVMELDDVGGERVRVTVTMLGFGEGSPWDTLRGFFRKGNATVLRRLAARFRTGPVDWDTVFTETDDSEGGDMSSRADQPGAEPVRASVTVGLPPEDAFERFTAGIAEWWPLESHSVGGERAESVVFEGRAGGRVYEVLHGGAEERWGEVLEWDPPTRIVYTWHPGRPPSTAQTVAVEFAPAPEGTELSVEHAGWERLGEEAGDIRPRYVEGWPMVLEAYRGR